MIAAAVDRDQARISSQLVRLSMESGLYSWIANVALAALLAHVHWREQPAAGAYEAIYWFGALAILLLARGLFCGRVLAGESEPRPAATAAYAVFAAAEGLAGRLAWHCSRLRTQPGSCCSSP